MRLKIKRQKLRNYFFVILFTVIFSKRRKISTFWIEPSWTQNINLFIMISKKVSWQVCGFSFPNPQVLKVRVLAFIPRVHQTLFSVDYASCIRFFGAIPSCQPWKRFARKFRNELPFIKVKTNKQTNKQTITRKNTIVGHQTIFSAFLKIDRYKYYLVGCGVGDKRTTPL